MGYGGCVLGVEVGLLGRVRKGLEGCVRGNLVGLLVGFGKGPCVCVFLPNCIFTGQSQAHEVPSAWAITYSSYNFLN